MAMNKPYDDWPPCRRAVSPLNAAEALQLDPKEWALVCEAQHGGYIVAVLTVGGIDGMVRAAGIKDPSTIILRFWSAMKWAKLKERVEQDIRYETASPNIINPYTGLATLNQGVWAKKDATQ